MLTTSMAVRPVPRRRSGRQSPRSRTPPARPPTATAISVATMRFSPSPTLNAYASRAPPVMSSPWAKFVRPVVPKISDRPTAAMASTRPNCRPPTSSCGARSNRLGGAARAAPNWKTAGAGLPSRTVTVRSPTRTSTPSGSVSSSIRAVYSPAPGTGTTKRPVASLSSRATSVPSFSTTTATPSRGVPASRRVPWIRSPVAGACACAVPVPSRGPSSRPTSTVSSRRAAGEDRRCGDGRAGGRWPTVLLVGDVGRGSLRLLGAGAT